jgi:hypothetical protein
MAKAKGKTVSKAVEVKNVEAVEAVKKVNVVKVPDVLKDFSDLKLNMTNAVSRLENDYTSRLTAYAEVNLAIEARQARLKELFSVEDELLAIDELKRRREELENEVEEYEASIQEERDREQTEYDYELQRTRKQATDLYNDQVAARNRSEKLREEELKRSWEAREQVLKDQENEVKVLRETVAGIDARVASEVKHAEAILTNVLKRNYEQESALAAKDAESARKILEAQNTSLTSELTNARSQVANLQSQLEAARAEVRDIAVKTVESASGQQALAAVQASLAQQNVPGGKNSR